MTQGDQPVNQPVTAAELLAGRRVCICVGPGGVGKTTTSAALALGMAARGLKVVVVTIDPARRLADTLGLEQLGNEPRRVPTERLSDPGPDPREPAGELWAMMLDPKRTFDDLIDRVAPSPERAAEIKRNGIYRELSGAVAGSQEFSAIEKLYELADGDYDLIVLDTPPAHSATEFLSAPGRLTAFLSGGALQALLRPGGLGRKLLGLGAAPLLGALRAVTGIDLISDLSAFFALLGSMTEEFKLRARHVEALLHSPQTAFLLVTSAEPSPVDAAIAFAAALERSRLPVAGAIVNRVRAPLPRGEVPLDHAPDLPAPLAARLEQALADHAVLAQRDALGCDRLHAALDPRPVLTVPELHTQVHDIASLRDVERHLFGADRAR